MKTLYSRVKQRLHPAYRRHLFSLPVKTREARLDRNWKRGKTIFYIPQELRLMIYEHLMPPRKRLILLNGDTRNRKDKAIGATRLALTCNAFGKEVQKWMSLYYPDMIKSSQFGLYLSYDTLFILKIDAEFRKHQGVYGCGGQFICSDWDWLLVDWDHYASLVCLFSQILRMAGMVSLFLGQRVTEGLILISYSINSRSFPSLG